MTEGERIDEWDWLNGADLPSEAPARRAGALYADRVPYGVWGQGPQLICPRAGVRTCMFA